MKVVKDWRGIVYMVGVRLIQVEDDPFQPTGSDWYHSFARCKQECEEANRRADIFWYQPMKYTFCPRNGVNKI